MVYAGDLIICDHCGLTITGEPKIKSTKNGLRTYVYYRCCQYNAVGHPRIRLTEAAVDQRITDLLKQLGEGSRDLADWMSLVMRESFEQNLVEGSKRLEEARRQLSSIDGQQDELLNLRLAGTVDQRRFEAKQTELKERADILRSQIAELTKHDSSIEEQVSNAGTLFQVILRRWPTADYRFKRRVLETLFGKLRMFKDELRPDNRTPFELLLVQ
jgi:chromosome segregation ATPase